MIWTRQKLESVVRERLHGAKLITVANREPYIHVRRGEKVTCMRPAGGLTTAMDPVMRACGGTWIGHGSGNADRETADEAGKLRVPPDAPAYTLRRVWLTPEEEDGYYYGAANSGLWPLCHVAYAAPRFDAADHRMYREVNRRFADAVLDEAAGGPALVFIHDYHFGLLARMLREARPDLTVMMFWHIPWPNREVFRVCPWKEEILDGLLGCDLLGFQIRNHCLNFLDTVDRMLEARVDHEHFTVTRGGHVTKVRPHPIGIDPEPRPAWVGGDPEERIREVRARLRTGDRKLIVAVDRVDYTKGIPERLRAFERLLAAHPEHLRRVHLVQVGAPSRTHIPAYRRLAEEIDESVERINSRFGQADWQPVLDLREHHEPEQIYPLYRAAAVGLVSSLHDGMNLVAKEFVSARSDLRGVLVLSQFTGSARELVDALLINPYAVDETGEALHRALTMPEAEQETRMRRLRRCVSENNVYRWAGKLILDASRILEYRQ